MDISRHECIVMMYIRDIREGDSRDDGLIATLILTREVALSMVVKGGKGIGKNVAILFDEGCRRRLWLIRRSVAQHSKAVGWEEGSASCQSPSSY